MTMKEKYIQQWKTLKCYMRNWFIANKSEVNFYWTQNIYYKINFGITYTF